MTKFGYKQTVEHKQKIAKRAVGRYRSPEYRKNISDSKMGEKNGMYKENAGYNAVHTWLRKYHIKPSACAHCEITGKKLDWATKTKEYKKDINEYVALCRSCHVKLDRWKTISL